MKLEDCRVGMIVKYGVKDDFIIVAINRVKEDIVIGWKYNDGTTIRKEYANQIFSSFKEIIAKEELYKLTGWWWTECTNLELIKDVEQPRSISRTGFDGCACAYCGNFFPMSTPNQSDGSLKCFSCRSSNRITKLPL